MTRRISETASPARKASLTARTGASRTRGIGARLLWAVFVWITWPAAGQDVSPDDATREVRLHILANSDSVAIGEPFLLAVTARHDTSETVSFPLPGGREPLVFGDLQALEAETRERRLPGGMQIDSAVYEVAAFAVDTARIAPIPVTFAAGGDALIVHADSAWIPVRSVVPEGAEGIRDLAPLVTFPRSGGQIAASGALLLLLAAGAAWLIRRRRNRDDEDEAERVPPIPPDREACDRLDALSKTDLSDRRNIPFFYDELSGILRTYVARRLHVQALEMTTGETVARLRERDMPDDQAISRFRNVLVACDYVKFADARPPAKQGADLIAASRGIVETIETQARAAEEAAAAEETAVTEEAAATDETVAAEEIAVADKAAATDETAAADRFARFSGNHRE